MEIDREKLLAAVGKIAAIPADQLTGGAPVDPAAAAAGGVPPGAMPPGAMPPGAAPPGGDPAAGGQLPGDMAAMDPMAQLAPMLQEMAAMIQQVIQGQQQMMEVFGLIADHLQLKAPASQLLKAGVPLGGGKRAELPPVATMDIQDGVVDDDESPEVTPVNEFYGTSHSEVPLKIAESPRTPLMMGDSGLPGDGMAIQLRTQLSTAKEPVRRVVDALRRKR